MKFLSITYFNTFLAWQNAFHDKSRAAVTIAGISFSILLMFMQIGFADAARRAQTLLYDHLQFDIMMTSDRFESLKNPRTFPAARLYQVKTISGVDDAAGLNVEWVSWMNPETEAVQSCMLVGIDLNSAFIRDPAMKDNLDKIKYPNTVMLDELSNPAYGRIAVDMPGKINGNQVSVTGLFRMGTDFKAEGRGVSNQATFYNLVQKKPSDIQMGLIRLTPGHDSRMVQAALIAAMPSDVLFIDRDTLINNERDYYTRVKPLGIFFDTGILVAFCIGAVVLFQILATEIANRFREYAMLKAIGLNNAFIYRVGFQQALIYGLCSYAPALAISTVIFYLVRLATQVPIEMTFDLAGRILLLSLIMCSVSSFLALQKIKHADPAELIR